MAYNSKRGAAFKVRRKQGNGGWDAEQHRRHERHEKQSRKVTAFDRKQRRGGLE